MSTTTIPRTPAPTIRSAGQRLSDGLLSATVRASQAVTNLGEQAGDAVHAAARRIDARDDTGAQAAEYAMLSGVGVAIAGVCIALFRKGDLIQTLLSALVEVLVSFVQSWFGG